MTKHFFQLLHIDKDGLLQFYFFVKLSLHITFYLKNNFNNLYNLYQIQLNKLRQNSLYQVIYNI